MLWIVISTLKYTNDKENTLVCKLSCISRIYNFNVEMNTRCNFQAFLSFIGVVFRH